MDVVDEFIARYTKEYDFYDQAARLAKQLLESSLNSAGVRCMVTARAKSVDRLKEKCRGRHARRPYKMVDDLFTDIVDLAGVRVAIYFPGEADQVDQEITRLFMLLEPRKVFPEEGKGLPNKRFSGYSATHYRVQLKDESLGESEKRYGEARIEIQVASVLMHAWSEVEHDLVYKPLEGKLSEEEYAILDELNGLVLAGEIALERLQKSGEARVAELDRQFLNHYDLAAHLISRARRLHEGPIAEEGMGRVDRLFWLVHKLELNTPGKLAPYLEALHGNFDERPLADQVIDALLAEDLDRHQLLLNFDRRRGQLDLKQGEELDQSDPRHLVGAFLTSWIALEVLIRDLARIEGNDDRIPVFTHMLSRLRLDPGVRSEIDLLRRVRNNVMHGIEIPPPGVLAEATQRVRAITELLSDTPGSEPVPAS